MRILVTGAAGFVGRHLVTVVERRSDLECFTADAHPLEREGHRVCDLLDGGAVVDLLREVEPAAILHLAGRATREWRADYQANVELTRVLLEAVRQHGSSCRVLLVGSAAEYGVVRPEDNPIVEEQPLRPASVYGLTKAMQSALFHYYVTAHGLDVVLVRPFNLWGEGMTSRLFGGRWEEQVERLRRGEIRRILVGDLSAVRDYLHVTQAASSLLLVAERGARGEIYNLGSGQPVPTRQFLAERLAEAGLCESSVEEERYTPGQATAVPAIWADVRKLRWLEQESSGSPRRNEAGHG